MGRYTALFLVLFLASSASAQEKKAPPNPAEDAKSFRAASADMAKRRDLGVTVDLISPENLAALEPGLPQVEGGAAYFPNAIFLNDPGLMVEHLRAAAMEHAGFLTGKAESLTRVPPAVR